MDQERRAFQPKMNEKPMKHLWTASRWSGAAVLAQCLWAKYRSHRDRHSGPGVLPSDWPPGGVSAGGPVDPHLKQEAQVHSEQHGCYLRSRG